MNHAQKNPSRILMTADTIGGVWTYALELARALEPYGVEIALATMGAPVSAAQWREIDNAKNVTVLSSDYKLEWMDNPWDDVERAQEWLLGIAEAFRPDVVHLNGYAHAALAWDAPVVVVAHSCVCSWWSAVKGEPAPERYGEYALRVARGLAAADVIVAPTAAMLDTLCENYAAVFRGVVIPNARDAHLFSPAQKQFFILAAGRVWDEAKNLSLLDAAAPHVRWPIEIAGDCTHPNGSQLLLKNARCLGKVPASELVEKLQGASIYALPARYEPFGLSVLEAALCGCALVLGDIASLRENWSDTAVFIAPDDAAALVSALNELIENESWRAELGRRAHARALEFSPKKMAEHYLAVYRDCAAARAHHAQHEQQPAEAAAA